jgi:hypothetical protein
VKRNNTERFCKTYKILSCRIRFDWD